MNETNAGDCLATPAQTNGNASVASMNMLSLSQAST